MIPTIETRLDHTANVMEIITTRLQQNDAELIALQNSIDASVINLVKARSELVEQLEDAILKHNELTLLKRIKDDELGVYDKSTGDHVEVIFVDKSQG